MVEDQVHADIQHADVDQALRYRDYESIHLEVSDEVFDHLVDEMRPELNAEDCALIKTRVDQLVSEYLQRPVKLRFQRFDHVVCKIGGNRGWGAGIVQALNEDDPADPTGQKKLAYVVKLDPPAGRLISVPYDENSICRAEVCFGQLSKGDLGFTLRCKPQRKETQSPRFVVGDRVACAVEAEDGEYTIWAPGSVVDANYDVKPDAADQSLSWSWEGGAGIVPYRVLLDSGKHVFVHRDVHWLLRDLALQPAGPRHAKDGTRNLKRLVKRRRGDTEWELIDHATRRTRIEAAADDDTDGDDTD